jgi:hypothetical protein
MAGGAIAALLLAVWLGSMIPGWIGQTENSTVEATPTITAGEDGIFDMINTGVVAETDESFAGRSITPTLLDQRLSETEKWLVQADDNHYSIQLFMTRTADAKAVERFLRDPSDLLDFEKIYVYETRIGGSRMYSVLYNDFDSRQTANSTLQNLPAGMKASKPFLRRVSALRKDLESSS